MALNVALERLNERLGGVEAPLGLLGHGPLSHPVQGGRHLGPCLPHRRRRLAQVPGHYLLRIEGGSPQDLQRFFSYFDDPVDVGAIKLIVR